MWATLSSPWKACLDEAWQAYCRDCVPIGAIITDAKGSILGRGRNRRNERMPEGNYTHGHPLAHAELNALISLDYGAVDPHTCILYTTTEPCPLCLGAFYMSGLRQLHYASRDPYAGSADLLGRTPYLSRKPVQVSAPERDDLELVIMALYVDYALRMYGGSNVVFDRWRSVVPASIDLGFKLAQSGEALRMRERDLPIGQVIDFLVDILLV